MRVTVIAVPHNPSSAIKNDKTGISVMTLPPEMANTINVDVDGLNIPTARHALLRVLQEYGSIFNEHIDELIVPFWDYNRLDLEHVEAFYSSHITVLSSNPDMYTAADNTFTYLIMRAI